MNQVNNARCAKVIIMLYYAVIANIIIYLIICLTLGLFFTFQLIQIIVENLNGLKNVNLSGRNKTKIISKSCQF